MYKAIKLSRKQLKKKTDTVKKGSSLVFVKVIVDETTAKEEWVPGR